jgi:hypothetical protein
MRVRHREYVSTIAGNSATGFNVNYNININPGLPSVFPYLSVLAQGFETYHIKALKFSLRPIVPTSVNGSNYMMVDYDSSDVAPNSKTQFMAALNATSAPVWAECCLDFIPQAETFSRKFVRSGTFTNTDLKTYDAGILNIASEGNSNGNNIADLFVEYDIELINPQLNPSVALSQSTRIVLANDSSGAANGYFYDSAGSYTQYGNTGIAYPVADSTAGSLRLNFQTPGNYLIEVDNNQMTTSDAASTTVGSVISGGASITALASTIASSLTADAVITSWGVLINDTNTVIKLLSTVVTALNVATNIRISKYAYSLF